MRNQLGVILICVSALFALGQARTPKYQPGTITAVTTHQDPSGAAREESASYDVSVKIGNVLYVVLYKPLNGANSVEYSPGIDMLFLVGRDTLTFNSKISGSTKVPILRREVLPAQRGLDWLKAPSQYFRMKQQHLSEVLGLSDDQQAKIKTTLEQESGEAGSILWDPVLSRKDKLKRYEEIVAASDAKIKPILSPKQVGQLVELRKQQREELKQIVAEQNTNKNK